MKTLRSLAFALLALMAFSACLQQEKVIKLKADGSGTIEETMVLSKQALAQMKMMGGGLSGLTPPAAEADPAAVPPSAPAPGAAPATFQMIDEKKLAAAAAKMGEGVTFVSAKPITTATGEGFLATYAFTDISKVRIDQSLGDSVPGGAGAALGPAAQIKTEPVTFQFTKGAPASLVVKLPQPKEGEIAQVQKNKPQIPEGGDDMAMTMMQQMFKGMRLSLAIEVAGKVTQSNAQFRNGSRVTLMEMDFDKVIANPEKFRALAKAQPETIQEMKALVTGVEGIKAEVQPQVTVKFQ